MMRGPRRSRGLAAAIVAGSFALWVAQPATATLAATYDLVVPSGNYYLTTCANSTASDPHGYCKTDNSSVYYYVQSSVSSSMKSRVASALGEYASTDLSVTYDSSPVYSGSGETDIIYQTANLDAGVYGLTWCDDAVNSSSWECDQQYVRFNSDSGTPMDAVLACHESGHAVGVMHGVFGSPSVASNDTSIMGCGRTPYTTGSAAQHVSSEVKDSINASY